MSNCTDCTPTVVDECQGEMKPTSCVYTQNAITTLGVNANEKLHKILEKIGLLIKGISNQTPPTPPEEGTYILKSIDGTLTWIEDV